MVSPVTLVSSVLVALSFAALSMTCRVQYNQTLHSDNDIAWAFARLKVAEWNGAWIGTIQGRPQTQARLRNVNLACRQYSPAKLDVGKMLRMDAKIARLSLAIFFSCGLADNWSAEPQVRFNLLTLPSSRQADLRLAMPARLNYQRAPLRLCVSQLAGHFQFCYWIDRRVDADKPLTLELTNVSLRECLTQLAQACDAEVGLVENVVTIAKPEHLAAMQYAAVRLHNQLSIVQAASDGASNSSGNSNGKSKVKGKASDAQLKPLSWPELTTPTELGQLINQAWGIQLNPDLPHDLMNAGTLQPCTLSTQLALLYGGFDRCAAGTRLSELKLLPIPKPGNWQSEYPTGLVSSEQAAVVQSAFSEVRLQKTNSLWTVVGPTAAHLQLLQPSEPKSGSSRNVPASRNSTSDKDPLSAQRFDISKQADKPLGAILKNLSEQLGLNVEWDPSLPPGAPHTLVTIEARKSKLDEILSSLGSQAKLSITREGTRILVSRGE